MYNLPTSLTFSGPFLVIHLSCSPHLPPLSSNILVVASGVVVSDVELSLESRVMHGSTNEIEARFLLKPDLCGRDGLFEKAEFVGPEGRIERQISKGLVN